MNGASRGDRIRSAKLAGAVLAVFVFAAWRVTGAMADTLPSGPRRVVAMGGDRSDVVASTVSRVTETKAAETALPDRDESDASIDPEPFRPLDVETAPLVRPAAPEAPSAMPPALDGALAPLPDAQFPVAVTPAGQGTLPQAPPSMQLTGVVVGAHPTAVVRIGDEEIVVRPGSRLPDGSTLSRIDATSVTLVREGRSSVLWVAE